MSEAPKLTPEEISPGRNPYGFIENCDMIRKVKIGTTVERGKWRGTQPFFQAPGLGSWVRNSPIISERRWERFAFADFCHRSSLFGEERSKIQLPPPPSPSKWLVPSKLHENPPVAKHQENSLLPKLQENLHHQLAVSRNLIAIDLVRLLFVKFDATKNPRNS